MSHLYAMNSAHSQGNMINANVEQQNRNITTANNAIANQIKAADSATTEKTFFQGAKDTLFDAYAIDKVNSKAEAYLTAAGGTKEQPSEATAEATEDAEVKTPTETASAKTETTDVAAEEGADDITESKGGGLISKGLKAAGASEAAVGSLMKGVGLIGSAVTLGTNVDADLDGQFKSMNWEQKVGNVGEIAGSVLDIVGTVFPPAAILAVAGTGITALAGAIGGIGNEEATSDAGKAQDTQLAGQKQALKQVQSQAGKTPIVIGS